MSFFAIRYLYLFAVFTENGVDAFLKMLTLSEKVQKDKIDLLGEEEDEAKLFLQIAGDVILAKDIEYTWILWQGENCRKFRLLTCNSFIGQFGHPVRGKGMGCCYFTNLGVYLYYRIIWCNIQIIIYNIFIMLTQNIRYLKG